MSYFVYILECRDGSFYTGSTDNVEKRLECHNSGKGAKYTCSRRPCRLVHVESYASKKEAMQREWQIKHTMSHSQKKALIAEAKKESESFC